MKDLILRNIIGDIDSLTLESKIFISTSVLGILIGLIAIFWNIYIGLSLIHNISIVIAVVLMGVIYYLARFKKIYNSNLFVLVSLFILSFTWFFNSGIKGSVPILYMLSLAFFLSITKTKAHLKILFITILNFIVLVLLERYLGDRLMVNVQDEEMLLLDNIFGYIISIFFSYLILSSIIRNYYKEREKLIRKELDMKRINDSKDMLFNIIAHDLRSPFTGLLGVAEIMADKSKELSVKEYQQYANLNLRTMTKTFDLLENLLSWGKIQQGKIQINPVRFNLKKVVEESVLLFEDKYKKKMRSVNIEISDSLEVYADRNSIQTVIRNLVSNAIKYTADRGAISVSAIENGDKILEVLVKDSGIGMSKDIVDSLFQFDI